MKRDTTFQMALQILTLLHLNDFLHWEWNNLARDKSFQMTLQTLTLLHLNDFFHWEWNHLLVQVEKIYFSHSKSDSKRKTKFNKG